MPTEAAKKERRYRAAIISLVAVGLIYMGVSIGVMNHLVQENNDFCAQRQVARTTIRTLFQASDDWNAQKQIILDNGLAVIVSC